MAEKQDEKSRLPLAGLIALVAMISGFLYYEGITLKTVRPIDKEKATTMFQKKGLVQSRLWQDPFEAIEAHRLLEQKLSKQPEEENDAHTLTRLVEVLRKSGISTLRVLPVFVDGSPYVNGGESRLKDRYAVVSALGAAGYVPESGEYLRFLNGTAPAKAIAVAIGNNKGAKPRRQGRAVKSTCSFRPSCSYPRPSSGPAIRQTRAHPVVERTGRGQPAAHIPQRSRRLSRQRPSPVALPAGTPAGNKGDIRSARPAELLRFKRDAERAAVRPARRPACPGQPEGRPFLFPLGHRRGYFSARPASRDRNPGEQPRADESAEKLFARAQIRLTRTIGTDAALAEQLVQELKRRQVDLKPCAGKDCNPKVALISEWDTLYGRSLPRTFAAVAMNSGSGATRGDRWKTKSTSCAGTNGRAGFTGIPIWLAWTGNCPPRGTARKAKKKMTARPGSGPGTRGSLPGMEQNAGQRPEGRGQLDYVLRLAAALKEEEAKNGEEFKAIGVLGSDVYDKLLILQALRPAFPRAMFFTTDLNARLAYPAQWLSTRNLIIASHYGLELQPALQTPIPPFRDSYQTSLFYSVLWAMEHFVPSSNADCADCFQLHADMDKAQPQVFSAHGQPRLYEIGRHGPFDISTDPGPWSATGCGQHSPSPSRPESLPALALNPRLAGASRMGGTHRLRSRRPAPC